jgi:hypothetical protein
MNNLTRISPELKKVIESSWFTIDDSIYIYTKVETVNAAEKHLLIARDSDEITIVTKEENLHLLGNYERNAEDWRLLNIKCGNPFYCEGFLAAISSSFASNSIDITLTSTFSNDYVMVQQENLEKATKLLVSIGFELKTSRV